MELPREEINIKEEMGMRHRHPGPKVKYRTRKGNIRFRKRPLHVQTLIFPKNKYNRKKALNWAKRHGFKHYTSREEGNSIRIRQFPPSDVKRYGGTFSIGSDIKGVYAEIDKDKFKDKDYSFLRERFGIPKYTDDDKDNVPNYKDYKPWDRKRHSDIFLGEYDNELNNATASFKFKEPNKIFINNWPQADEESIEEIARTIDHEELHNIISKEVGDVESFMLDGLGRVPEIRDRETDELLNPNTAGEMFLSTDKAIEAAENEVGQKLNELQILMEENERNWFQKVDELYNKSL